MDAKYTGRKITELRKQKGWTQKDVAEKLHVSIAAVSKWERGLNYPDLSLMEGIACIFGITVSELLGLENEPTEQVIRNITEISVNEKTKSEKIFWKKLLIVAVTVAVFIVVSFVVYISVTNNEIMRLLFEFSGGAGFLNLLALALGLAAWSLAIMSILSRKNECRWKYYSFVSLICCAAALYIPTLVTYLIIRFEYVSTVEDIIGGDYFASSVLFFGTVLFNICSILIHRMKEER